MLVKLLRVRSKDKIEVLLFRQTQRPLYLIAAHFGDLIHNEEVLNLSQKVCESGILYNKPQTGQIAKFYGMLLFSLRPKLGRTKNVLQSRLAAFACKILMVVRTVAAVSQAIPPARPAWT